MKYELDAATAEVIKDCDRKIVEREAELEKEQKAIKVKKIYLIEWGKYEYWNLHKFEMNLILTTVHTADQGYSQTLFPKIQHGLRIKVLT